MAANKGEKKFFKSSFKRRRVYVSNLPPNCTKEDLVEHFSGFGPLHHAFIIENLDIKLATKYGYVEFEDPNDALKILNQVSFLKGNPITCLPYIPK